MSLINDALKRAKQAQQANAPAPESPLQFRPVEPAPSPPKKLGVVLPATLAVIFTAAAISLWQEFQTRHRQTPPVAVIPANHAPTRASLAVSAPAPAQKPAALLPAASSGTNATAATNAAAMTRPDATINTVAPPPPMPAAKPAPPRLQAIVFSPLHPSAIIDGRTVFVGDLVGKFRIAQIRPNSATLVSRSRTNVLTLE